MPVLVVVLLGGFVVNFGWCLFLNIKNHTTQDYVRPNTPLFANLIFAGLAGALWCSQFICFKTGEPAMGKLSYIGWSVLMASTILFSTVLGIFLGECKNIKKHTRVLLAIGLVFLVASAGISGYSGKLSQHDAKKATAIITADKSVNK
jgi:L-rhamnose-H+ transport protein